MSLAWRGSCSTFISLIIIIMKTIIVPTDFSPVATNAMNFAADMAANINASLMLLHVYQVPVSLSDVPVVMVSPDELRKSSETKLQELKNDMKGIASKKIKIYTEARMGDIADELEDVCKHVQPFAVTPDPANNGQSQTSDQVKAYAAAQFAGLVAFFDGNGAPGVTFTVFAVDWRTSSEFRAVYASVCYTSTPVQQTALWKTAGGRG